jgi:ATP-dependent DNA helicase RecG
MNINDPIEKLRGVNSKIIKQLDKLGTKTIRDLLFHIPRRYDDFSIITKIKDVMIGGTYTISGIVLNIQNIRAFRAKMTITEALLSDGNHTIKAIWYNQAFLTKNIQQGQEINIAGKVLFQQKSLIMQNPAYEIVNQNRETKHTGRLVPIYKETRGLSSRWLRLLVQNALPLTKQLDDFIPAEILKKRNLLTISDAIKKIHFPGNRNEKEQAKKRLSYEELFLIQLVILDSKKKLKQKGAPKIIPKIEFTKEVLKTLPFKLTDAQKKVLWQVMQDMERNYPANRLVEGDVGSGKTLVALLSAANAAKNGWQSAFMIPTEILAIQHFNEATKVFKNANLSIALQTASEAKAYEPDLKEIYSPKKPELIKMINSGKIDIVIGTHSLIQDKINFKNLGLVILDEQHRFGVNQRAKLIKNQKMTPHLLSMTATPIPRTLAMTLYGDLDISIIDQMPENRKKTITKCILGINRKNTYVFIESEVKKGRQIFVICPKIENKTQEINETELSETQIKNLQQKAVKEEYEKLSKKIFPHLRVAMLHGKMKPKEKEEIMRNFKNKEFDILVSTSVVEVGVDVPNATIMMIEGADRFGLAQLHQFRGRVGRDKYQSYCFLFSDAKSKEAQERLKIMEISNDGFSLAEQDLKMRGPGDFIGKNQSGIADLTMEALMKPKLISEAQEDAKEILENDPNLKNHPKILKCISEITEKVHFE